MIRQVLKVQNKLGLHARAAAKLVRLTTRFNSEILLARKESEQRIDAKSILGVLMLAAPRGTYLVASIDGLDEVKAGDAIRSLFDEKFGEEN